MNLDNLRYLSIENCMRRVSCPSLKGCTRSTSSVPKPCPFLFLLLLPTFFSECFQLCFADSLPRSFSLETSPVVRVCSCIYIKERVHLSLALILITKLLWIDICTLPFACKSVECPCGCICCCGIDFGGLCIQIDLWLINSGVVCIRVVISMDCWVVSSSYWFLRYCT